MNLFIAKKVYLASLFSLLFLFLFSCLSAVWQYHRVIPQFIGEYFTPETEALLSQSNQLQQIKGLLEQQGQQSSLLFEVAPENSTSHNTQVTHITLGASEPVKQQLTDSALIKANRYFINASLDSLNQNQHIKSAYFIEQTSEQSFDVMTRSQSLPETKVLRSIVLRDKLLLENKGRAVATQPFYFSGTARKPENQTAFVAKNNSASTPVILSNPPSNYLVYRAEHNKAIVFWLVELEPSIFLSESLLTTPNKALIWENNSGFLINSVGVENKTSFGDHPILASHLLPHEMHKQAFHSPTHTPIIPQNAEMDTKAVDGYVLTKVKLAGGLYNAVVYQSSQTWFLGAIAEAMKSGLIVFIVGCIAIFVLVRLIVWRLAVPTAKLISHIEDQDVALEDPEFIAPDGWQSWFGKVQRIFTENKRLIKNLSEKNKQLDIEIRSRTRELLQQTVSKDRHLALNEALMNSIPDLLYYKNVSGGYLGCNKAYENYIGFSEVDLVTKLSSDIYPPKKAEDIDKIEQEIIARNEPYVEQSWSKNAEGDLVLLLWLYSPITSASGEVLGTLGLARDITEQQSSLNKLSAAVERAERADQIKGEFIANISHEVRTPMNSIIGMLQLLDDISQEPNQKSYIKIADSSAKGLLAVINNILDFSKASAHKLEVENEIFGISSVIDEAFANCLPKALKKGLILDSNIPLGFPEFFRGDAVKLGQIFTNLLGNAVKFTHEGSVKLSVEMLDNRDPERCEVQFRIVDTGIGIEKEKQNKVFEAFSQADSSVTRKYGGTGLGLTIVYQLVEALDGVIAMTSGAGQGTEFTVKLSFGKVDAQPNFEPIDCQWTYWESNIEIDRVLQQKLEALGAKPNKLNIEEEWKPRGELPQILLCRPDSLKRLPSTTLKLIKLGKVKLQPVAFELVDNDSILATLPHYPLLTAPFNAQSLLSNLSLQEQVQPKVVKQNGKSLSHLNLLVVEDNLVNQQVIKLMLQSEQAQVDIVNNGQEALDYLAVTQVDIVVSDIQMPIMDGLTLAAKLREKYTPEQLPIIAVSAHTNSEDVQKSHDVGISHHLTKPVNKDELFGTLLELVPQDLELVPKDKVSNPFQELKDVVDIQFLLGQFSGSEDSVRKILTRFYQSQTASLKEAIELCENRRFEELTAKLHNLKGVLGSIGAKQAHKATIDLEQTLKTGATAPSQESKVWIESIEVLLNCFSAQDFLNTKD